MEELKEAMKNAKKVREYKRYQALYVYFEGKGMQEVSELLDINRTTLSAWYKKYMEEGLEGLKDRPIKGRPPRLSDDEREALKKTILEKTPAEEGLSVSYNWTASLIAQHIKEKYGYTYCLRGITRMLERMGMSYTRPTYVLAKADKEKQEAFKEAFEEKKKPFRWRDTAHPIRG